MKRKQAIELLYLEVIQSLSYEYYPSLEKAEQISEALNVLKPCKRGKWGFIPVTGGYAVVFAEGVK
jgi:hypothetical protein